MFTDLSHINKNSQEIWFCFGSQDLEMVIMPEKGKICVPKRSICLI